MATSQYSVSREAAATQLGVSTRTLDRWLRAGKLRAKAKGRTIFVHAGELGRITVKQPKARYGAHQTTAEPTAPPIAIEPSGGEKVFQRLYEEVNGELKAKQEKLEAASFRVGQLEAQVKASVPLLEYKQREDELQLETRTLREQLNIFKIRSSVLLVGFAVVAVVALALGVGLLR